MYGPGTGNPPGFLELNVDHRIDGANRIVRPT
jgi:hypothetical protein